MKMRNVSEDFYNPRSTRNYVSEELEIYKFGDRETFELMVYECGREKCEPGHSFDEIRNRFLIHFILKGKGSYTVNGKTYELGANQGFIVRMGEEYSYRASEDNPWEYVWVGFNGTEVRTLLGCAGLLQEDVFEVKDASKVISCFLNMNDCAVTGQGRQYRLLGELYVLFSYLIAQRETVKVYEKGDAVRETIDQIVNNFCQPISIADIAKKLNYNRSSLYRKFIAETGKSPQEFLIEYRIKMARQDLEFSNLSLIEVCYACGFNNYAHFSTQFRKLMGVSPAKYREAKRASRQNDE